MTQRPIKFRAWSERRSFMNYDPEYNSISELINSSFSNPYDNYIFMQFTGLHDKNGKEIYEGDMVRRFDQIGYVEYGLVLDTNEGFKIEVPHFGFKTVGDTEPLYGSEVLEVIGNIYENPELLEKV